MEYQHGLQPRIGLGVSEITDSFGLRARIPIGRWFELLTNGAFVQLRDISAPDTSPRRNWDAYVGASSRLKNWLRRVVGYRFRVRDELRGALPNDRATASLVFWERAR